MKYKIIRSNEVGVANHGWLNAKHYFSFGGYYNPQRMGFGRLLVVNDDVVEPQNGFGKHPHRDMEIITIPQLGAVSHEDSEGNKGTISKGEVQVMSAGTGVFHSEFNNSENTPLNLFQIWIEPNKKSVKPRYDQKQFAFQDRLNQWTQLVSPMGTDEEGLKIHQNAFISAARLQNNFNLDYKPHELNQGLFLLIVEGEVNLESEVLTKRDAVQLTDVKQVSIQAQKEAEIILIEVPLTSE